MLKGCLVFLEACSLIHSPLRYLYESYLQKSIPEIGLISHRHKIKFKQLILYLLIDCRDSLTIFALILYQSPGSSSYKNRPGNH